MRKESETSEDYWGARAEFREAAARERLKLNLSSQDYWAYLAAQIGGKWSDRSVRAYAMDRNQFPSQPFVIAIAKHFGKTAEDWHCPDTYQRRDMRMAKWAPKEVEPAVMPDAPPPPRTEPKTIRVQPGLVEFVDWVRTLDEDSLKVVETVVMPLKPYLKQKK